MKKLLLAVCLVAMTAGVSFAKDGARRSTTARPVAEEGKLGLGYTQQLTISGIARESLSLRYWVNDKIGVQGMLGFGFGSDTANVFNLGGKFLAALKKEQNITVYGFGMLGFENYAPKTGSSESWIIFAGGLGAEYFLIPNLGISAEAGLKYDSNTSNFRTFGDWLLLPTAGIHYYF